MNSSPLALSRSDHCPSSPTSPYAARGGFLVYRETVTDVRQPRGNDCPYAYPRIKSSPHSAPSVGTTL
ncbi:hypothetical protein KCP74_23815 [Salmonella enterica subsp. enterica]|nr:hypothetical protein KCP74_23815 [Salmonella enterica subsp. enterica]